MKIQEMIDINKAISTLPGTSVRVLSEQSSLAIKGVSARAGEATLTSIVGLLGANS